MYLPDSFIGDDDRRRKCGVPQDITFLTKAQLGLEMIRAFSAAFSAVSLGGYGCSLWGTALAFENPH
jgi:hypothetical protein